MYTAAGQAIGEQGDRVVDQNDEEPAKRPFLSGVQPTTMCNDGTPNCSARDINAAWSSSRCAYEQPHAPSCRRANLSLLEATTEQLVACGEDSTQVVLRSFYSGLLADGLVEDEDTSHMKHKASHTLSQISKIWLPSRSRLAPGGGQTKLTRPCSIWCWASAQLKISRPLRPWSDSPRARSRARSSMCRPNVRKKQRTRAS